MKTVDELTISSNGAVGRQYHEFEGDDDAQVLAEAMLAAHGTRAACLEEMLYMAIVAAVRDDQTTLNGLACLRKYWRDNPLPAPPTT